MAGRPQRPRELLREAVWAAWDFPWWMWVCGVVWLGLLVAWLPTVYSLVSSGSSVLSGATRVALAWLIGAALSWTVLWGGLVAYRKAWPVLLVSAPLSTVLLMACYVAAMLASPAPSPSDGASPDNDNAAGAGLVILAVPTLALMALLLGVGAGAGWCVGHCRYLRRAATAA
ncbi:hypothetical protein [Actinacidiphila acidipaludis]|uniref:Transmembrane protein n=1 Tax=Actinacidiphila acidipaludis TaxID=2873382 RepID=A0ABS7PZ62_9ACTN|nr:hypothetical protein [Streptomyces acidipaludis]MBY8876177.1 hypothetical protein [Streptomyces acidipaludis]